METHAGVENKAEATSEPPRPKPSFWARPLVIVIGSIVLAFLFFLGTGYVVRSFTHESTDDAFLDGPIISIAPRISGQVTAVHVRHNQHVKAGDSGARRGV